MWTTSEATDDYQRQRKWFRKKLNRELDAMLLNLADFVAALNSGSKPMQVANDNRNSISTEPQGVFAIRQRRQGTERNLNETRLYVYPDLDTYIVHLLTIGDKESQSDDIQFCKECVAQLNERKVSGDDQK